MTARRDDDGPAWGILAAVAGAAAAVAGLAWLSRRAPGTGAGPGRAWGYPPTPRQAPVFAPPTPPASPTTLPPYVRITAGDQVEVDEAPSDLLAAVARTRRAGAARYLVTGDARHGWVVQVLQALQATGARLTEVRSPSSRLNPSSHLP